MEDKQLRRMYHVEIETSGVNMGKKVVVSKPRFLEHSRKTGKTYKKMINIIFKDKKGIQKVVKLDKWMIPKPSQDLIDYYETQKKIFKRLLYQRLDRELTEIEGENSVVEDKRAVASEVTEQSLTDFQKAIFELLNKGVKSQKSMVPVLEAQGFNACPAKISQNIKWMKKKGIIIIR